MIFVGNRGCIQIHTGPITRLLDTNGWLNVLDPDFNLHLREPAVARVFSVRKPTDDGVVTSIEAFDGRDRTILLMFGARKPGKPELAAWQALVARLEKRRRRETGVVAQWRWALSPQSALPATPDAAAWSRWAARSPRLSTRSAPRRCWSASTRPASIPMRRGACRRSATCVRCRPKACCRSGRHW